MRRHALPWSRTVRKLEEEDYRQTQSTLQRAGALLALLDLDAFINTLNDADSRGANFDPTAYRAAMKNLADVRELAEAAAKMKTVTLRLQTRLLGEAAARAEQQA